jgi:hypothetical protein
MIWAELGLQIRLTRHHEFDLRLEGKALAHCSGNCLSGKLLAIFGARVLSKLGG